MASSPIRSVRGLFGPLVALSVIAAVVAGPDVTWTSATPSAAHVVTDGALERAIGSGQAFFTLPAATPGTSTTATATVANTGDLAGDFTLVEDRAHSPLPAGDIELVVTDVTDTRAPITVFSGDFGAMDTQPLGELQPEEVRSYEFA